MPTDIEGSIPSQSEEEIDPNCCLYRLLTPFNWSTLRRWLDILLLTICGAAVNLLISPILLKVAEGTDWMVNRLWRQMEIVVGAQRSTVIEWLCYGILVVIVLLSMAPLVKRGVLRLGHARTFLLYPPVWLPAILATLILSIPASQFGKFLVTVAMAMAVLLAVSAFVTLVISSGDCCRGSSKRINTSSLFPTKEKNLKEYFNDPEGKLIPWLLDDKPICSPSDDLFETHKEARKIAEYILAPKLGSIGLNGPWGSGKSTALNITKFLLLSDKKFMSSQKSVWHSSMRHMPWYRRWSMPRILITRVNAWGFAKEAVASVILKCAVDELGRHMDCLSVHCLPNDYLSAIKGATPEWLHLPLVLAWPRNPEEQMERLDSLLLAINARLILFVEDIDRNIESSSQANRNCLSEVESLLDRMKDADRVSFVLAYSRG